jgi:antitoxin CcdA
MRIVADDPESPANEARSAELARKERWRRWREENRAAIEDNNRRIEEEGLWSDGLRLF